MRHLELLWTPGLRLCRILLCAIGLGIMSLRGSRWLMKA